MRFRLHRLLIRIRNRVRMILAVAMLFSYYMLPFMLCLALAGLAEGWLKVVFVGCALAWPIGNLVAGIVMGCD